MLMDTKSTAGFWDKRDGRLHASAKNSRSAPKCKYSQTDRLAHAVGQTTWPSRPCRVACTPVLSLPPFQSVL